MKGRVIFCGALATVYIFVHHLVPWVIHLSSLSGDEGDGAAALAAIAVESGGEFAQQQQQGFSVSQMASWSLLIFVVTFIQFWPVGEVWSKPEMLEWGKLAGLQLWLPPPPDWKFPVVVRYHQDDVGALLNLRRQCWNHPETQSMISEIWVGNRWLEAIMSMLPSAIYNSKKVRSIVHILFEFALPIFAVLQGVGVIMPLVLRYTRIVLLQAHADVGLAYLARLLHFQQRMVWRFILFVVSLIEGIWSNFMPTLEWFVRGRLFVFAERWVCLL